MGWQEEFTGCASRLSETAGRPVEQVWPHHQRRLRATAFASRGQMRAVGGGGGGGGGRGGGRGMRHDILEVSVGGVMYGCAA